MTLRFHDKSFGFLSTQLAFEQKQNVSWTTSPLTEGWGEQEKWYTDILKKEGDWDEKDWARVPKMCKQIKSTDLFLLIGKSWFLI